VLFERPKKAKKVNHMYCIPYKRRKMVKETVVYKNCNLIFALRKLGSKLKKGTGSALQKKLVSNSDS